MTLTSKEYAEQGGSECPYCERGNITGGAIEVDANVAWMNVRCNDCGKEWTDEYILTGYSEVE